MHEGNHRRSLSNAFFVARELLGRGKQIPVSVHVQTTELLGIQHLA